MALQLANGGTIQNTLAKAQAKQDNLDAISKATREASFNHKWSLLPGYADEQGNALQQDAFNASTDSYQGAIKFNELKNKLELDPWGAYRASAADTLAQVATNDPTQIYQSKLASMVNGQFGVDDPSYKFRVEQGQQALERSQAAHGMLGSGNAAIELTNYGQNAGSQEYQAQFGRLLQGMQGISQTNNTRMQQLMSLAGVNLNPAAYGQQQIGFANAAASQTSANASATNAATGASHEAYSQYSSNQEQAGIRDSLQNAWASSPQSAGKTGSTYSGTIYDNRGNSGYGAKYNNGSITSAGYF